MNFRGLFKLSGVCAIGFAIVNLVSYLAWIGSNGFLAQSSSPLSPDRIYTMLHLKGTQMSLRLDLLSYFLLIPSLVGIFAYLRDRRPGRAHLGGAFAAFALIGFFASTAISTTAASLVQSPLTDSLRERLVVTDTLSFSIGLPALYAMAVANLLWGLALRTYSGLARQVGTLFLAQVAGVLIAATGFFAHQDLIGNVGILINVLAAAATYALLGVLLSQAAREALPSRAGSQEKPRAAGASV